MYVFVCVHVCVCVSVCVRACEGGRERGGSHLADESAHFAPVIMVHLVFIENIRIAGPIIIPEKIKETEFKANQCKPKRIKANESQSKQWPVSLRITNGALIRWLQIAHFLGVP